MATKKKTPAKTSKKPRASEKSAPKTSAKKVAPKKKTSRIALKNGARGKTVIDAIVARLTGPDAISGAPRALTDAEIRAAEKAANAALSPALFAAFTADAGHFARDYGWFDKKMNLLAKPFSEIVEERQERPMGSVVESLRKSFYAQRRSRLSFSVAENADQFGSNAGAEPSSPLTNT